jgi:hypothetical protein
MKSAPLSFKLGSHIDSSDETPVMSQERKVMLLGSASLQEKLISTGELD